MPKRNVKLSAKGTLMKKSTRILIGVALLCTLAIGTTWVLHNSDNRLASETTPNQTNVVEQKAADGTPAQAVKPTNQFDIPELGIKMLLPVGLEDLTYEIQHSPTVKGKAGVGAHFGTVALNKANNAGSYCTASSSPLGMIVGYNQNPDELFAASGPTTVKQIGDYYVGYFHPQQGCSEDAILSAMQEKYLRLMNHLLFLQHTA